MWSEHKQMKMKEFKSIEENFNEFCNSIIKSIKIIKNLADVIATKKVMPKEKSKEK